MVVMMVSILATINVCAQGNSNLKEIFSRIKVLPVGLEKIQSINQFIEDTDVEDNKDLYYLVLTERALTYELVNQPTESLKSFLQAKQLINKKDNEETYSDLLYKIGQLYSLEGLHTESTKYFEEALEMMMVSHPESKLTINLMQANGDAYASILNEEKASYFYSQILEYYRKTNNVKKQISTLQRQVNLFYGLKKYDQALVQNEKLKELIEQTNTDEELYLVLNNLGYNYNNLTDYPNAIRYFKESIEVLKANNYNKLDHYKIQNNIAIAYSNLGNYDKSIDAYFKSEKLLEKDDWENRGNLDLLMAKTFLKNQDYQTAMKKANDAIEKGNANTGPVMTL